MFTFRLAQAAHERRMWTPRNCEVLIEVLRPFYEGGKTKFQRLERRIVRRMLCELRDFIKQLKKEWLNAHPEFRE